MKKIIFCTILLLCLSIYHSSFSQTQTITTSKANRPNIKKNIIKLNLGNFLFKNYGVQYERILSKHWSAAFGIRTMPSTIIPFKDVLFNGSDKDTKDKFDALRVSNIALTPELRFYVGKKGYGRGFYLSPYYRYASFKLDNLITESNQTSTTAPIQIPLTGKFDSHSFGLMLGSQFSLSKKVLLDWWILGGHYGSGKATLSGTSSRTMTAQEQSDIRKDLQDINGNSMKDIAIYVDAKSIQYSFTMPWIGIRAGLSIGIKL